MSRAVASKTHSPVALAAANALLVLDNCEHVADAVAALIDRLLARCPRLHILVTSRARLVLPFEHAYVLGGLPLTDAIELSCRPSPFGRLATRRPVCRPRSNRRDLRAPGRHRSRAGTCSRANSVARTSTGSNAAWPVQSQLLVGGARASAHHRSMHDTIAWSFELLTPLEQDVLRRVCVFVTGFDADAAASVAGFATVVAGRRDEHARTPRRSERGRRAGERSMARARTGPPVRPGSG